MRHIVAYLKKEKYFAYIYLGAFLLSFQFALVVYINSSFLSTFVSEKSIGVLYAIGSAITIVLLLNISKILRKYGNQKMMSIFISLSAISLIGLSVSRNIYFALGWFLLYQSVAGLMYFSLDIFLETETKTETHTGGERGIFLTMGNLAFVIATLFLGKILYDGNYRDVYIIAALFLLVLFYIVPKHFKKFRDPEYPRMHTARALEHFTENKNLSNIYATNFILQFFYAWMVIYMPLYLHSHIGFSWGQIGEMFSIMLLPFIFIQIPGGHIADSRYGEKEMLIFGLIIMVVSVLFLPFIGGDFLAWTFALFATRCGAALVEIMAETYFFKHVKGKDSNIIGFYRTASPLSDVIAPLVASVFLVFFDLKYAFFLVALMLLWGIKYAMAIKDTRSILS